MIISPLLNQNSKAIIIAPSGKVPAQGIDKAIETLTQWGLKVSLGKHLFSSNQVFAGNDAERLSDLQKALDDSTVSLILCARGGYGLTRILDKLSFKFFYKYPKWLIGFSDVTAFHLAAVKNNVLTIHGPMGTSFNREGAEGPLLHLNKLLFTGESNIGSNSIQLKTGTCKGQLVGGNLSLICDSLSTFSEIDTEDKILVLEDAGDYYYRVDRLLNQLARAKKLKNLRGLIIGSFSDICDGETAFGESVSEMVIRLTSDYDYPIAVAMPIGHEPENYPFVHGAEYKLEVNKNSARLELLTKL